MVLVRVLLVSTYELGRQPFGLASPTAWLRADGHDVTQVDVSRAPLSADMVERAELIAFFLPMHTATRLFFKLLERVRRANSQAHLCAYGLYAPLNQILLRQAGIATVLGGEFELGLCDLARRLSSGERVSDCAETSLDRLQFRVPDRVGLPPLASYAQLVTPRGTRRTGYTEASRGCKHWCRHCPVTPVYQGVFRVVQQEVVLEDIRRQVAAGAEHITFGDPDFFNGPGHAMAIAEALHAEWPEVSFDVTIKIEHLLKHRDLLPRLRSAGCLFVTSAVESLDDAVLEKLEKGHTAADFYEALRVMREAHLEMSPTFIPFTPWTTHRSYAEFLRELARLGLAGQVAPIQLAIRLLIPEGSLLLELPEVRRMVEPFDSRALAYPWHNPDRWLDALCANIQETIKHAERQRVPRSEVFRRVWDLAGDGALPDEPMPARATIPYLTEPWYC